jgi:hypothetical protein
MLEDMLKAMCEHSRAFIVNDRKRKRSYMVGTPYAIEIEQINHNAEMQPKKRGAK